VSVLSGGLSRATQAPRRLARSQLRLLRGSIERFGVAFTIVSWLFAAALGLTASAAIGATLSQTKP
jgi:hypothetical protein